MSGQLLSLGAWYFLPNLVTGWAQNLYYRVTIRAGDPMPQPGHPRFERHKRNIFVVVIVSYLLYTIYEADWELQRAGDFYRDLAVPITAEERGIQARFRRLTVMYHPDKLSNPSPDQLARAEAFYVHLKNARDTLVEPAKRFAYDRFGPEVLHWKHCVTKLDFVTVGLKQLLPYYLVSAVSLVAMGFFGYAEYGRYWQYFTIAFMFTFEVLVVTRPALPIAFGASLNSALARLTRRSAFLQFQIISIARRAAVSVFIAVAQIAPRLKHDPSNPTKPQDQQMSMNRMYGSVQAMDSDVDRLLKLGTVPFMGNAELEEHLKVQLRTWLVHNEIRNTPEVNRAINNVMQSDMIDQSTVDGF